MKHNANYNDEPVKKERGNRRRQKNQIEKELLNEFYAESPKRNTYEQSSAKYYEITNTRQFEGQFTKPKNESQEKYADILKHKSKKIVVATGPAGTGKTLFATEQGVKKFLEGTYEKLIFTRPSVSVDEDLGYLPGTLEDKMAPWIRPIYDILYNFFTPKEVTALLEDKLIEIAPLGYMRGRPFKNCWIVADEMQNSTVAQMKMLMTRLGENSRLIVTGDLDQYDKSGEVNGLEDFLSKFKGKRSPSITSVEFQRDDIQREDVVKEVLDIYSGDVLPLDYQTEEMNNVPDEFETKHNVIF
jgi:phosphate starvation-inducible protein PhoH